ncbi:MAG: hypothetical protein S4CHLAM81_01450 [Chlamydiales bacterium]|nr:hypothetical protein [Chlamydiales bacterium]MCH9634941.1 hypothetical protein [Chlamydiales bacterium]
MCHTISIISLNLDGLRISNLHEMGFDINEFDLDLALEGSVELLSLQELIAAQKQAGAVSIESLLARDIPWYIQLLF